MTSVQDEQTFKKRIERKFVVNASDIEEFVQSKRSELKELFKRDHASEAEDYVIVTNVYFDTPTLDCYRDSIEKVPTRYKLRLRSYSTKNTEEDISYFEMKYKNNGIGVKRRVAFKNDSIDAFITNGDVVWDDIFALNKEREQIEVLDLVDEISKLIHEKAHRPILRNTYRRQAFKFRHKKGMRLTIDSHLKNESLGESCAPYKKYEKNLSDDEVIVEIKVKDIEMLEDIPQLMNTLGEKEKFSKFCFGLEESKGYLRETESILGHEALCNARLDGDLLDLVKYQMDGDAYTADLI